MRRILIAGDVNPHGMGEAIRFVERFHEIGAVSSVAFVTGAEEAARYAQAFDALVLTGGKDLHPETFGQTPHPTVAYDNPMRDTSDELLFRAFHPLGKRILGICRGCQAVNVYLGGTLHQHLPDAYSPVLWHAANIRGRHPVTVKPGTLTASLVGAGDILVNSSHHQAIDRLGEGLTLSASSPDGVVEAAESGTILLLQWHPEYMPGEQETVFQWIGGR